MKKNLIVCLKTLLLFSLLTFLFFACGVEKDDEVLEKDLVKEEILEDTSNEKIDEELLSLPVSTYELILENLAYQNFLNIKIGMSYDEISGDFGEGEVVFEDASIIEVEYLFEDHRFWIKFVDGFALKKWIREINYWNVAVEEETFLALEKGFNLEKVRSLLGDGQLIRQEVLDNAVISEYFWNVKTGFKSINLVFENEILREISNINILSLE